MGQALRLLIVDDSQDDAELTLRALRHSGFTPDYTRVCTPDDLDAALKSRQWDAVVCDYAMPTLDAPSAFAIFKKSGVDLPFIIVSGTVSEENAVKVMKLGAHDYLSKERLMRLGPAIERELAEAKERAARRLAESRLRASEDRYRALFDGSPIPTWLIDLDTLDFLAVNDAAIQHYGYERFDFASQRLDEIGLLDDPSGVRRTLAGPIERVASSTWQHKRKDGSTILIDAKAHDFDLDGRRARLLVMNDVTELRRTEEQLRQAQKMEAVGRLAGGIAHDFNNLLGVILSYNELTLEQVGENKSLRGDIDEVRKAALRAADLTRQLLAFSRQQVLQPRVLDLNVVVRDIQKMLTRLLGEDIHLALSLASELGRIEVDAGQLTQVIMNLAINARDAMPNGGKLVIETANAELDVRYAQGHEETAAGSYVMLAVSDSGIGMDAETRSHIFEPFFTTKEVGKGTGLGLSTVFGIVKQSNGHIWVYSEPEHGTTFKVYFPRVERTTIMPAREARGGKGDGKILVVEDEPALRQAILRVLAAAGYTTWGAAHGAEALTLPQANEADLVITDLVMPLMGGRELIDRLRERNEAIRALFMSGYTDRGAARLGTLEADMVFLQKPFTPEALRSKVREILGGKR